MVQHYEALDLSDVVRETARLEQGQGDFMKDLVRMPEKAGFVVVRILPPAKGAKGHKDMIAGGLCCATRIHKLGKRNLHCPRVLTDTPRGTYWKDVDLKCPCPICKYNSELWKESEDADEKRAKELQTMARDVKAFERYYYNVIVRKEIDPKTGEVHENVGPKILSVGVQVHEKIIRAGRGNPKQDEPGLGDITEIKNGRDFKIIKDVRPGKDAFPEYNESKFMEPSPLGNPDQCSLWLSSLHDLSALRVLKPAEEMKIELKKHLGIIKSDDGVTFDINEYRKPAEGAEPAQTLEEQVAAAKEPTTRDTPPTAPSRSAPLVAQEFLDELNKIKP